MTRGEPLKGGKVLIIGGGEFGPLYSLRFAHLLQVPPISVT